MIRHEPGYIDFELCMQYNFNITILAFKQSNPANKKYKLPKFINLTGHTLSESFCHLQEEKTFITLMLILDLINIEEIFCELKTIENSIKYYVVYTKKLMIL